MAAFGFSHCVMKTMVIKKLIAAACVVLAVPCAWHTSGARAGSQSPVAAKKERVKELFVDQCARCHGRNGRGKTALGEIIAAPDFTDPNWWKGVSDARIRRSIANGKGEMPDFGKKLKRADIAALAAYVRAFAPEGVRGR